MQAYRLVRSSIDTLQKQSRYFEDIYETAKTFVVTQNRKLEEMDSEVEVETSFPLTRYRGKKI